MVLTITAKGGIMIKFVSGFLRIRRYSQCGTNKTKYCILYNQNSRNSYYNNINKLVMEFSSVTDFCISK